MTNNDLLIRLRYALDIKNTDMVHIFELGGISVTKEDILNMLIKVNDDEDEPENFKSVNNKTFEAFLNGLITFKRGQKLSDSGEPMPPLQPAGTESPNNLLFKKVKIALTLTTEDIIDFIDEGGGIIVSKGEIGAILRNQNHKNYKECGDSFTRYFLRGLTNKYRNI